ncbi:MAG: hypothetical protein QXX06_00970 [Candidatus Diapherotrites archaeon]
MRLGFGYDDLRKLGYKPEEIDKKLDEMMKKISDDTRNMLTIQAAIGAEKDPKRREETILVGVFSREFSNFINEELKQNRGRLITALANIISNEQDPNRRRVYIKAGVNALLENKFEPARIINEFLAAGVESKMLIEALVYYGADKATIAKILIQTGWSSKDAGILFSSLKK